MKIGILTIHYGVNHGSALQTFALNWFLNKKGFETETINYIPKRYRIWNTLYNSKRKKFPKIIIILYYPIYCIKVIALRLKFSNFLKENVKITKKIEHKNRLIKVCKNFDKIIVGSDQVWNDDYNGIKDNTYFLDFIDSNGIQKNAYAASFGITEINNDDRKKEISRFLQDFKTITVREEDALNILSDMNINNAKHVVDPSFLLSKEEWVSASKKSTLKINSDYILVYVMDGIYENLLNNALIISKELNLPIYVVCFKKIKDSRIDKCFTKLNPFDFVKLISNAAFVVTNSFHGTAFSVIMRKRFVVVGKQKYNSRMLSLLKKLDLRDNFINYDEIISKSFMNNKLNNEVLKIDEEKLNNWINESKQVLIDICEDRND